MADSAAHQHRHNSTSSTESAGSEATLADSGHNLSPAASVESLKNFCDKTTPQCHVSRPLPSSRPNVSPALVTSSDSGIVVLGPHDQRPAIRPFDVDLDNSDPLSPHVATERRRIDLFRSIVAQLGGTAIWPTATTRTDGIKLFTLTSVQIAILICPAFYAIASLTFQALSYFAAAKQNAGHGQAKMQSPLAKPTGAIRGNISKLIEIEKTQMEYEKSQASTIVEVLDALHQMIKSCGPNRNISSGCSDTRAVAIEKTSQALPLESATHQHTRRQIESISKTVSRPGVDEVPYAQTSTTTLSILSAFLFTCALVSILTCMGSKWPRTKFLSSFRTRQRTEIDELPRSEKKHSSAFGMDRALSSAVSRPWTQNAKGLKKTSKRYKRADIWTAAARGGTEAVLRLHAEFSQSDFNAIEPTYGTLLAAAAQSGEEALVKQVLDWGLDPNIEGGRFHTPLQAAAHSGNTEVLRMILSKNARVGKQGGFYNTALVAAAEKGSTLMVRMLVESGGDDVSSIIDAQGSNHNTALMAAAFRGQSEMINVLLDAGATVDERCRTGLTALHLAVIERQNEAAKTLVRRGASVNTTTGGRGSPFEISCRNGSGSLALFLLQHGAMPFSRDNEGWTPLHHAAAAEKSQHDLVEAMLPHYSREELNASDGNGFTALHHASCKGHIQIMRSLLSRGIDISKRDKWNAQALFLATSHFHAVQLLLSAGADVNAAECFRRTALHRSSNGDDARVQELLLAKGSDVNVLDSNNKTPLHEACNMGRLDNVRLLLAQPDIEINVVDNNQRTPLHNALSSTDSRHSHECFDEIVHLLLDDFTNADVNLCNSAAFFEAIIKRKVDIVDRMINLGANVHAAGGRWGSPLHAASCAGSIPILELLFRTGRQPSVSASRSGEFGTALQAAAVHGHVEVVEFLLQHGAEVTTERPTGRYGSAMNAVEAKMTESGLSRAARERFGMVRDLLVAELGEKESGGRGRGRGGVPPKMDAPHLKDRWVLAPSGWGWLPPENT